MPAHAHVEISCVALRGIKCRLVTEIIQISCSACLGVVYWVHWVLCVRDLKGLQSCLRCRESLNDGLQFLLYPDLDSPLLISQEEDPFVPTGRWLEIVARELNLAFHHTMV